MSKNSQRTSQNRILGKNFEYRVRNWLVKRGWKASRVPVSGAAAGFKNDIHAIFQVNEVSKIRIEIECKKTKKKDIRLLFDAIRKVEFESDEIGFKLIFLVFATIRSELFCIIPKYFAQAIIPNFRSDILNYTGKESIVITTEIRNAVSIDDKDEFFFEIIDKSNDKSYLLSTFKKVVSRLENYGSN